MTSQSPQKILFIIDKFNNPFAGTEGQLLLMVKHLDRKLFTPHLLVFEDTAYLQSGEFPCEYTVANFTSLRNPVSWFRLFSALSKFRDNSLAHIFFNDASIVCPPFLKMLGIRSIISRRDMGYWYTTAYLKVLNITRKFVDQVVVNSNAVSAITLSKEGYAHESIKTIYNGYELENFSAALNGDYSKSSIKKIKNGCELVLVLVANIRPIKRMQDAICAISEVRLSGIQMDLVIVGAGDKSCFDNLVREKKLNDHVHFIGSKSDVKSELKYADIGILCSESEGFSNAIIEYQLMGLPVVASNVGGNPEAVKHGENGFLFNVGDVSSITKYLKRLANDKELRGEMSNNAKITANSTYDIKKIVSQYQDLYAQVIS